MGTRITLTPIVTAEDLSKILDTLRESGSDLSTIYLLAADGEHFAAAGRREMTLSDGSSVTDVILWTSDQARALESSHRRQ